MAFYVLQKTGNYHQGVYFVSQDKDKCMTQADIHAKHDVDDYHDWQVHEWSKPVSVDEMITKVKGVFNREPSQPTTVVYSVCKRDFKEVTK